MNELVSARPDRPESYAARFRESMRAALQVALDFALPRLCPSCREPVSEGEGLCAPCWSRFSLIEPPYCERLGIPFAYDPGPGLLSMEAIANPPAYNRARAVARYDDVASTLVHGLKYSDRLDLSPMMGRWMARAGRELSGRCRCARSSTPALAKAMGTAIQSIGRSCRRDIGDLRRPHHAWRAQTYPRHAAAGRTVSNRSAPTTSKGHFWSRLTTRSRLPAGAWCWSTTCSRPAPRLTPAPAHCCGRALHRSMCWYSRGL